MESAKAKAHAGIGIEVGRPRCAGLRSTERFH
jgi:hypothetical protein